MDPAVPVEVSIQNTPKSLSKMSLSGWTFIFSALFIVLCFAVIYLIGRIRKQDKKLSRLENQQQNYLTQDDVYPVIGHYIANPLNRPHLAKNLDFMFETEEEPDRVYIQRPHNTTPVFVTSEFDGVQGIDRVYVQRPHNATPVFITDDSNQVEDQIVEVTDDLDKSEDQIEDRFENQFDDQIDNQNEE